MHGHGKATRCGELALGTAKTDWTEQKEEGCASGAALQFNMR